VSNHRATAIDPSVAGKFKIISCTSTSCSKKRKSLGLDSLATFGALYSRAKNGCAPAVSVEEGPCMGGCKMAPCVSVEHDEFVGGVSLEGMSDNEFSDRV
jgi:NADH:ubiquinone oxidoreductase subunit E